MTTPDDDGREVFMTGNFNGWQTHDPHYRMTRVGNGKFQYTLPLTPEIHFPLNYKYTKGNWDAEEIDASGVKTGNHELLLPKARVNDKIDRFLKDGQFTDIDFSPLIETVSDLFPIKSLHKRRRIRVLLPHNYHTSDQRYSVLYLQDAQNLWDKEAPFGTWGIDEQLKKMAISNMNNLMIVAIDHGDEERVIEFTPVQSPRIGKSEGRAYLKFIVRELKPYIDLHYRTLSARSDTGIGGSSMGGLISIYAGLIYPEVFSKLMIFSPSLWVTQNVYLDAIQFQSYFPMRIYLYAGGKESTSMLPNITKLKNIFEAKGYTSGDIAIKLSVNPSGGHSEKMWGGEFIPAVKWLFYSKS